jgi:hypothetical protein
VCNETLPSEVNSQRSASSRLRTPLSVFILLQFSTLRSASFFADVVVVVVVADRCESIRKKIGGKEAAEGLK